MWIKNGIDHLTELPLFGGRFSTLTHNSKLSIFGPHRETFLNLIDAGINKVQDLARDTIFRDYQNCTHFKTRIGLYGIDTTLRSMNSLLLSLSRFSKITLKEMGLYTNLEFIQIMNKN